ncbi:unnamed protein product [Dibothriocephalus latus]|uniref:RING-type domain-containing protein n=1 Tax=Dibothriocephalus latus TaxID=60516 RepID=A0A3P7NPY3_DIBLA|nr:unnamed protein product [Dibothriocephalus latus]
MDFEAGRCALCKKTATNPQTLPCGCTFCLYPCLLPDDASTDTVTCPFCFIETSTMLLEPGIPEPLQFIQNTRDEEAEVRVRVETKLSELRSQLDILDTLTSDLLILRTKQVSLKENLKQEVNSASEELLQQAVRSLGTTKNTGNATVSMINMFANTVKQQVRKLSEERSSILERAKHLDSENDIDKLVSFKEEITNVRANMEFAFVEVLDEDDDSWIYGVEVRSEIFEHVST